MPSLTHRATPRLYSGGFGMVVCRAFVLGLLEQESGNSRALGCCFAMIGTVTIIPFMPDGWDAAAGFPAMKGNVAFLMKDVVLLAVSFYLLKQDAVRVSFTKAKLSGGQAVGEPRALASGELAAR